MSVKKRELKSKKTRLFRYIILIIILVLLCCVFSYAVFLAELNTQYFFVIKEELSRYDTALNEQIILSIIKTESNFDKSAKSKKGAVGLMQIIPATAHFVTCEMRKEGRNLTGNLLNEKENIAIGVWYLTYLEKKFGTLDYVLVGYNAGETVAKKWERQNIKPKDVPYKETKNYVKKVNFYYENYVVKSNIAKIVTKTTI